MSIDWDSVAGVIDSAVGELGTTATLRHFSERPADGGATEYDPAEGSVDAGTVNETTVNVVLFGPKSMVVPGQGLGGSERVTEDRDCVIGATDGMDEPRPGDELVIGSETWTIRDTKPVQPGTSVVAYEARIER